MACAYATGRVRLAWPYHAQTPELCVRDGSTFVFLPAGGQFEPDTLAAVKIDDAPVAEFSTAAAKDLLWIVHQKGLTFTEPQPDPGVDRAAYDDWETRMKHFYETPVDLTEQLPTAHTVTIELPLYDNGRQQVTFNVAGLKP